MKNLFAFFITLSLLSFTFHEETYKTDIASSKVQWLGKKTTGQHNGEVALQSGYLRVHHGTPVGGEFVLNMKSISVTDIKDAEDNKNLVEHLKADDFFGTEKFPTAILLAKKFEALTPDAEGNNYKVTADLTIKGVKNEIQFPAKISASGDAIIADAKITIDRTRWGISYKSKTILGNMADKFIYDDIAFTVKLVLQKQK